MNQKPKLLFLFQAQKAKNWQCWMVYQLKFLINRTETEQLLRRLKKGETFREAQFVGIGREGGAQGPLYIVESGKVQMPRNRHGPKKKLFIFHF